jgi:hypothetical protein
LERRAVCSQKLRLRSNQSSSCQIYLRRLAFPHNPYFSVACFNMLYCWFNFSLSHSLRSPRFTCPFVAPKGTQAGRTWRNRSRFPTLAPSTPRAPIGSRVQMSRSKKWCCFGALCGPNQGSRIRGSEIGF